jgi:hypothetical protein
LPSFDMPIELVPAGAAVIANDGIGVSATHGPVRISCPPTVTFPLNVPAVAATPPLKLALVAATPPLPA